MNRFSGRFKNFEDSYQDIFEHRRAQTTFMDLLSIPNVDLLRGNVLPTDLVGELGAVLGQVHQERHLTVNILLRSVGCCL